MKMKSFKRVLSLALATAMVLTACGQKPAANTSESTKTSESAVKEESKTEETKVSEKEEPKELPMITLYPEDASMFSGEVTGWRADVLAEHGFKMEIWAYSEERTIGMLTSGDFPDMMYIGGGNNAVETLTTLIETDKIINYEDYKEYLPDVFGDDAANEYIAQNFDNIRENFSAGTGGLYILPFNTGTNSSYYNQVDTFTDRSVKLKWDVYEAIGAPEVTDMWSLIDIVEQMVAYQPTDADGNKTYGAVLHNSKDKEYFGGLNSWYKWHGGDAAWNNWMAEANYQTGEMSYILEEDSLFKSGIKWYYELNKRGLLDPDSISMSSTDQNPKTDAGLVMIPTGTKRGKPTTYYEVFPEGCLPYQNAASERMASPEWSIVIFKDSEHIEECLEFVNMMADPYEVMQVEFGPEGVMWQEEGNVLTVTDAALDFYKANGTFNGFPMPDGTNYNGFGNPRLVGSGTAIPGYVDKNGDALCWQLDVWPEVQEFKADHPNWVSWQETMDATDLWDYVEKNNINYITQTAYDDIVVEMSDPEMQLRVSTLIDLTIPLCWQMVYAESDEEFEALWTKLKNDAEALGAKELFEYCYNAYKPYVAGLQ